MKRSFFEQVILYDYRYLISYSLMVLVGLYGLFWRLGSLVPGLSSYEADYINSFSPSLSSVAHNPIFWPHKLLTQLSVNLLGNNDLAFRLPTAFLAALALAAFFLIIRHRFQGRVAMVAILLLATSSWWLSASRLARPEIMIPLMMLTVVLLARVVYQNHSGWWLSMLAIAIGISFYVPLMPYVLLIGAAVSYSLIRKYQAEINTRWLWLFYGLLLLSVVPLIIALFHDHSLLRVLMAWPEHMPGVGELLTNMRQTLTTVFWSGNQFTPLNLGNLPFLDIFTVAMVVLGLYFLDQEVSRALTQFLIFGFLCLLVVMNLAPQPGYFVVLIPFIYTLVAAGIVMLFSQWYEIFPRNPVARMVAFIPTVLLIFSVIWYHHTRYFVAWPNSPDIITTFPPLSSALEDYFAPLDSNQRSVILVNQDETTIAQAASWSYANVQVTTVPIAALGQPNLAISDEAYANLEPETRELINRSGVQPYSSSYSSQPVVLWYASSP